VAHPQSLVMELIFTVLIYIGFFSCIGALLVFSSLAIWHNFAFPAKVWSWVKSKVSKSPKP